MTSGTLVLDVLRIIVAFVGVCLAAWQIRIAITGDGVGWRAHLGVAIALLILCGSRIEHLGQPVTWQFGGTVVVVVLLTWSAVRRARQPAGAEPERPVAS